MMRRLFNALLISMVMLTLTGCAVNDKNEISEEKNGNISASGKKEGESESVFSVNIEDAYYLDLLSTEHELYTLAVSSQIGENGFPVVAWKSADEGISWDEALYQPDCLGKDTELIAGVLNCDGDIVEAYCVFEEQGDETNSGYQSKLFHITEESYEELAAEETLSDLGGVVFKVSYVNDHVICLASGEKCVFFDVSEEKELKQLTYDSYSVSFVGDGNRFLIYGAEVTYCLDRENLEEIESDENLKSFVKEMFEANGGLVFPPMVEYKNTLLCFTADGIFEYKDGNVIKICLISDMVNGGFGFNGILPACRGGEETYYISTINGGYNNLQRIKMNDDQEKTEFLIYCLDHNEDVSKIAMMFQQSHPELIVKIRVGMEDSAALTRTDAIKNLNTELLAGEGPDIIIMDGLSVEHYVDTGLLNPIKTDWKKDNYFAGIMDRYTMDGSLYAVPIGFWLYAVQGADEAEVASAKQLGEWIIENAGKEGLSEYIYTPGYNVFSQYVNFLYDTLSSDICQNDKADEELIEYFLRNCMELKESCDSSFDRGTDMTSSIFAGIIETKYNNNEVTVSAGTVVNTVDLAAMEVVEKDNPYSFCNADDIIFQPRNIIAVNANTQNGNEASEFVKFALGDRAQKANFMTLLPVSKSAFQSVLMGEQMDVDPDGLIMEVVLAMKDGTGNANFMIYRPDHDSIGELSDTFDQVNRTVNGDVIIRDIVMTALEEYLTESLSLEETVSYVKNKIDLYMGE